MESAGPVTRSRLRSGATGAAPSSAAPSTRKKAAPRSTRKSVPAKAPPASPPKPASNVEDVPVEDADDTAAAVDIPETSAQTDKAAPTPAGADAASDEPQGTPAPSGSGAIGGLTPAGATPADFGPSPVMPIKLDSLWTPGTAQQDATNPYAGFSPLVPQQTPEAAAADAGPSGVTPENSGVDLAAMFISTPAGAPRSCSPIAGVVATEEIPAAAGPTAPQQQMETPSANDSVLMGSPALPGTFAFAGLTSAAAAGTSGSSPARIPGAYLDASGDAPQPSAPLLPPAGTPGTPGWSVDTELPPAGSPSMETLPNSTPAARLTPGSVRGGMRSAAKGTPAAGGTAAKRTPGGGTAVKGTPGASLSPMDNSPLPPAGPPDFSDMESPLPPAISPMMQEDATEPLQTEEEEALPPAGSPMLSLAGTPAAETPLSSSTPAAAVAAEQAADAGDAEMEVCAVQQQEAIEAEILQSVEAEAAMLERQVQAIPTDSGSTGVTAAEYSAEEVHAGFGFAEQQQQQGGYDGGYECDDDCMMGSEGADEADVSMQADTAAASAAADATAETGAMELSFGSPAGAVAAGDSPTPICFPAAGCAATPHSTPAAAGVTSPGVTSPGARYRSSSAKTAAPPKSALAKPKTGSSSAAPKHAHVVVPDAASPKTTPPARSAAGRSAPGSTAARFTDGQRQQAGGSPGHTPFPSKAKVRAATAAATAAAAGRTAAAPASGTAATAATSKAPSHKKEMALAAAHSALKRYSKAVAEAEGPDAGTPSPTAGTGVRRSSASPSPSTIPNVSSRLMQPTASSSAKTRSSGASDQPDALMWSPPSDSEAPIAAAAAAGSSRPRLASKIVVPSPVARDAAADPSIKALKRSIKSKVAEKARATVTEGRADTLGADAVRSSKLASGSSKAEKASRKAAAAAEEELDLDYDDYDEGDYEDTAGEVDALADTLAGLSVKPINVAQPKGPLKGVAAPVGRHFKFDDSGNAQETPMSRQRRAPTHIKFDDEGNPVPAQKPAPRWR